MKSNRFVLGMACVAVISVAAPTAFAAKTAPKAVAEYPEHLSAENALAALNDAVAGIHWTTDEELAAFLKKPASSFNRKIASTGDDYGALLEKDDEFKALRNSILSLKAGTDVWNALAKMIDQPVAGKPAPTILSTDRYYDSLKSPHAKLMALEMAQLLPLRGIIYRLVEIGSSHKAVHTVLLTKIMKIATHLGIYQPTTQAPAMMAYLTEPYPGVTQFKNESEFQRYVQQYVVPATEKSRARLAKLDVSKPIVIDNALAFHPTNPSFHFIDDTSRFALFQEGERQLLLAEKCRALKNQMAFISFDIAGFLDLVYDLGRESGLDGFAWGADIDGVPTQRIVKITTGSKFKKLLTFKETPGGVAMYNAAFYNVEMVNALERAYSALDSDRDLLNKSRIFNMEAVSAMKDQLSGVLKVWHQMVRGRTTLVSRRTSEQVVVDVPNFWRQYSLSPEAVKARGAKASIVWDAKSLLPTAFEGNGDEDLKYAKKDGIKYRNYHWGMPTAWNAAAYRTVYPQLSDGAKVDDYQRVMKESEGGRLVANLFDWVLD